MNATRTVVSTFGLLTGLAGIEHGIGEVLQGAVKPDGPVILSWPNSKAVEVLGGEPALTIIPNLLVTGITASAVALAVLIWSVGFVERRHGGPVLILLSVLLLAVGGGFGPPLIGIVIGLGATRIGTAPRRSPGGLARALGRLWPWVMAVAVLGYLSLLPGSILLHQLLGVDLPWLVPALSAFSYAALVLALVVAREKDSLRAGA